MHFISPLDIHFTHDNINPEFSPFLDAVTGKRRHPTLLQTIQDCLGKKVPDQVDMLDVVWHQNKIFLAGTFNRRLCVWRLLCIFFPERFARVKVKFKPEREKEKLFTHRTGETKFSTKCKGDWIEIRWNHFVGKQRDTHPRWHEESGYDCKFDPGVQWPEAEKLLTAMQAKQLCR